MLGDARHLVITIGAGKAVRVVFHYLRVGVHGGKR